MRYIICERVSQRHTFKYHGMDRYGIWIGNCPKWELVKKTELIEIAEIEDENYVLGLYQDVLKGGFIHFDLLSIDKVKNPVNWTFIGFDIGEKNNTDGMSKWSAIHKYDEYTTFKKIKPWINKLNSYGLFDTEKEASKFRTFYLNSSDPVLKEASRIENDSLYQVSKIYLCTKFDYLVYKNILLKKE
jgi:hypothetical protein